MTFTVGFLAILFGLKVPVLYWVYYFFLCISIGLVNSVYEKDDKGYDKIKDYVMGLYPIMIILDSNYVVFNQFGYTHHSTIYNFFSTMSWVGVILCIILCGITLAISKKG